MFLHRRFPPILLLVAAACAKGPAWGSDNAVIAAVDPALREQLEPTIREGLAGEVFTTRVEPVFEITFASSRAIGEFRKWKRIVVFQPAGGGATLVPELLGGDALEAARSRGVVAEVDDKWARDQTIWVVSAPTPDATVELARGVMDSLYQVLHDRYVAEQVERMWVSEPDSGLARELLAEHGFALVLPRVYRPAPRSAPPQTVTYFNEDPRRVVSIHWLPRPAALTPDTVLAIRRAWGAALFPGDTIPARTVGAAPEPATAIAAGDTTAPEPFFVRETTLAGRPAVRLQGVWHNPTDHTAGIFLTFGVACGDELVLLDGNLFAPDRPKYPYVIQLERIFDTFRCARQG